MTHASLKQRWQKLGMIFKPGNQYPWMNSFASNPFAELQSDDVVRIYFSCRDEKKRSSIGWVEYSLETMSLTDISSAPVLVPGEPGYFDDSGTTIGSIVRLPDGTRYLYYLGWNLATTVPWRNFIGLAIAAPNTESFLKYKTVPVMDRSVEDPLTLTYPWVMLDDGRFRMWYASNITWHFGDHGPLHLIKYAESNDGIQWRRAFEADVLPRKPDDYVVCRPCVIKDQGIYKMWFSYRGAAYRIGYAESSDGHKWTRLDDACELNPSEGDWDSDSVEYPCVFRHGDRLFMLYNGKGFGETGFGLAVLQ